MADSSSYSIFYITKRYRKKAKRINHISSGHPKPTKTSMVYAIYSPKTTLSTMYSSTMIIVLRLLDLLGAVNIYVPL